MENDTRYTAAIGVGAIALVAWKFGVRAQWVRASADLYTTRLFEAIETLAREHV